MRWTTQHRVHWQIARAKQFKTNYFTEKQSTASPLHTLTVGNLQSQLWLSLEFRSCVGHPTLHAHHTCIISSAKHDNDNCTYSNTPMDTLTDNH